MSSQCTFHLSRENPVYFSGEVITGTVNLITTKEKTDIIDITVSLGGSEKVEWLEDAENTRLETSCYSLKRAIVNVSNTVYESEVLPAGAYTFHYEMALPPDCPTSCESKFGHVRYQLFLIIQRKHGYPNIFLKPVTVIKHFDLNLNENFKLKLEADVKHSTCFLPCSSALAFNLEVPFAAYAPGQSIRYAIAVNRQSFKNLRSYFLDFIKKLTYVTKEKELSNETILLSRSYYKLDCIKTKAVINGRFQVPPTPPSTRDKLSCIQIEYYLKISLNLKGCNSSLILITPIIIGTIPITESLPKTALEQWEEHGEKPEREEGDRREEEEQQKQQETPKRPKYRDPLRDPQQQQKKKPKHQELPSTSRAARARDQEASTSRIIMVQPAFSPANTIASPFIDTEIERINYVLEFQPLYPMYYTPPPQKK